MQIDRLLDLIKDRKPVDLSKDKTIKWLEHNETKKHTKGTEGSGAT